MEIVTLAFNRPDFLELQLNSLEKWVPNFNFTVFDNCPDDAIKDECKRLGIKCIPVKIFSADPSWCVGLSLDKMWETLQHNKGELLYLDSDMFLINSLPKFDCDMAFITQYKGGYKYPWTGLMYFNMDTLPHPEELSWHVDYALKDTDVGGRNHFYLEDNTLRTQDFKMYTIIDEGKFSMNGMYITWSNPSFLEMEKFARDHNFPRPYSLDLITHFKSKSKPFIFHYKSASNYPSFYTPKYNELKTKALCKLLTS